ncbi:MAG TPA: helix-turn-helix domain-containing protein [Propionicimonas sp.]|jgi:AcrR family transcriptional regulator|nr:helix-turn-helix domain-containing protein [Propionicimonas sp.]
MSETTPVSLRRQHTKERLLAAATELFAERSVQAASVEEICERAGFTRGAFYSNFDSKDELVLELVRQRGAQLVEITQQALSLIPAERIDEDALSSILSRINAVLAAGAAMDGNWVVVRAELQLYAHRNPELRPALAEATYAVASLAAAEIGAALQRQNATLRIPLNQLIITMDAYFDRMRSYEILGGDAYPLVPWQEGLEHLVRALVVFPEADA